MIVNCMQISTPLELINRKQNLYVPDTRMLKLIPWSSISMGIRRLFVFKSLFFLEDKVLVLSLLTTFGGDREML